jgi:hypothetical protein
MPTDSSRGPPVGCIARVRSDRTTGRYGCSWGTADYEAGQLAAADGEFQAIIKGSSQQGTTQIASDKLSRQYFHDQKIAEDRGRRLDRSIRSRRGGE